MDTQRLTVSSGTYTFLCTYLVFTFLATAVQASNLIRHVKFGHKNRLKIRNPCNYKCASYYYVL